MDSRTSKSGSAEAALRRTTAQPRHDLRGLLWCALCRYPMRPVTTTAGARHYACPPCCTRRRPLDAQPVQIAARAAVYRQMPRAAGRLGIPPTPIGVLVARITVGVSVAELRITWRLRRRR